MKAEQFRQLAGRNMCLVAGYQREVKPDYCVYHNHPAWEVVYHISGSGFTTNRADGSKVSFENGDLIIYPPGLMHDQKMQTGGEDVCVIFSYADGGDSAAENDGQFKEILRISSPSDPYIPRELVSLANMSKPSGEMGTRLVNRRASAVWMAIMMDLAASNARSENPASYPLAARRFLRQNCCTIEKISDIARHLDISEDYLRHCYSQHFGSSMVRDLKHARIEHAANLLLHSSLPLKAIASISALGSEQYFCTSFKQLMGCTPSVYRKRAEE